MNSTCPRCQTVVLVVAGRTLSCPTCGFTGPPPAAGTWKPVPVGAGAAPTLAGPGYAAWVPPGAAQAASKPSMGLAVAALLVNVLVLPGLGSIIGGRLQEGIWQLLLSVGFFVVAIVLFLSIIGILLLPIVLLAPLAAWIWGLITGIQLVQRAS